MTSLVGETIFINLKDGTVIWESECHNACVINVNQSANCYRKQVKVLFHDSFEIHGFYCSYKYRFNRVKGGNSVKKIPNHQLNESKKFLEKNREIINTYWRALSSHQKKFTELCFRIVFGERTKLNEYARELKVGERTVDRAIALIKKGKYLPFRTSHRMEARRLSEITGYPVTEIEHRNRKAPKMRRWRK